MPTDLHPVPALRMSGTVRLLPICAFLVCMGTTLLSCIIIKNAIEWGILQCYACNIFVSHIQLDCIHMIALYLLQALKLGIIFVLLLIHNIYFEVLLYCLRHFFSRSKVHSAVNEAKKVLILIAGGMSAPTASLYYVDQ